MCIFSSTCVCFQNPEINILALTVLNEILYKNCVPNKSIPLIISICSKVNDILLHISQMSAQDVNEE